MDSLLTPIQKLDTVLKLLQTQNSYKTKEEVTTILSQSGTPMNEDDLIRILDKLINDGFVIETKQDRNGNHIYARYLISYSGILFDNYASKFLLDAADAEQQRLEIDRLRTLDLNVERNQTRLNRLTRWLAVGTIVLAVMEIIKFLCEMDSCIKAFFEKTI
jgi:DNA-binding PadR family transcriptional regulator